MGLYTDKILQKEPFNLTEQQLKEFNQLAKDLDLTLDDFFLGKVYKKECAESPEPYTEAELEEGERELVELYHHTFDNVALSANPTYDFTLGAPGVGKSVFTESKLVTNNHAYVDPDRQALRFMSSFKQLTENVGGKTAYEIKRDQSNGFTNLLLVWAIYKGYNVVHGTTATNPRVAKSILPKLKSAGYKVNAHVLFASAESRKQSLLHRIKQQDFYQVTEADAKGKVAPVFDRLMDAILKYADTATMYLNSGEFWLNTTLGQNSASLRKFASLERDQVTGEAKVVGVSGSDEVLAELITQVRAEVKAPEKKEEIIQMFNSWLATPVLESVKHEDEPKEVTQVEHNGDVKEPAFNFRNYLPGFNRNTAIAAAAGFGILATVVAVTQNESIRKSILARFKPTM